MGNTEICKECETVQPTNALDCEGTPKRQQIDIIKVKTVVHSAQGKPTAQNFKI